jgi:hypothetical protein
MIGGAWVLNALASLYFTDATLASALMARWCVGPRPRRLAASSKCVRMSQRRELGRVAPDVVNRHRPQVL